MSNWFRAGFYTVLLLHTMTACGIKTKENSTEPKKENTFINCMIHHYHYKRKELIDALFQAKYDAAVIDHINHPDEEKSWNVYRHYFITGKRIQDGVNYWKIHAAVLRYAKCRYGIPPSIIVAIIGVETNYGEYIGKYSALNTLTTLAFHYNHRSRFFTRELAHFFLLVEKQKLPVLLVRSSYAGAIGIPQFMPSTYWHYATNYLKKGYVNLMKNNEDTIISIANFLHTSGWKKNQPIACEFTTNKPLNPCLISKKMITKSTINYLKNIGIISSATLSGIQKAAIIQLKIKKGNEKWLIFTNFDVIMHYNPRIIYAMTVYQLSQAIQKNYN